MRRAAYALLALPAVVVAVACGKDYTSSDTTTPEAGSEASAAASPPDAASGQGNAPPCPAGCLFPAPAGWVGPSAIHEGEPDSGPSACPLTYPDREPDTFMADAAPPACTCVGGGTPQPPLYELAVFSGANCTGGEQQALASSSCSPVKAGGVGSPTSISVMRAPDGTSNGSASGCCIAHPVNQVPKLDQTTVTSCASRVASACAGRADCNAIPTPEQPFDRICIHAPGDVACPNTDYPNRFVSYTSLADTRGCNPCVSTPTGGNGCGVLEGYTSSTCPGNGVALLADGGCNSIANVVAVKLTNLPTACVGSGGGPDGGIALDGAVTYCCTN